MAERHEHPFPTEPSIDPIKREHDVYDQTSAKSELKYVETVEKVTGANARRDTSEYDVRIAKMQKYQAQAKDLKKRINLLMMLAIKSVNHYVGDAPEYVLDYINKLTGLTFPDLAPQTSEQQSDPRYVLDDDIVNCIFRIAGYYDSARPTRGITDKIKDKDMDGAMADLMTLMKKTSINAAIYGFSLLWLTIKMCMVVAIHYTAGYFCWFFKYKSGWKLDWSVKIFGKRIGFCIDIGASIGNFFGRIEVGLLKIFGYSCAKPGEKKPSCANIGTAESVEFTTVECCTANPIFFQQAGDKMVYLVDDCFESYMRNELGNVLSGPGFICSAKNAKDVTLQPTAAEIAMAKAIAEYLMQTSPTDTIMDPNDISNLQAAERYATAATDFAATSESALGTGKNYVYTGERTSAWDCFGYQPGAGGKNSMSFDSTIGSKEGSLPFVEKGTYMFEVMDYLDGAICDALKFADKIVLNTANLAKWGSSRQLCCWVYLTVLVATVWQSMVVKGKWCPDFKCSDAEEVKDKTCADAIRTELQWAASLRGSKKMKKFLVLLTVLKKIVDMFIRQQKRALFLSGLKLPLHDMWEAMKMVILTNLSEALDILLGPFDQVLAGLRGTPEIRNMINNDCFGFGSFLDFLSCMLGNIKMSILAQVEKFISFQLNDIWLWSDITVNRKRLKVLQAFSNLLKNIINLLMGLKDCYDPNTVVKEILEAQTHDQYTNYVTYYAFVGEHAGGVDECLKPVTDWDPEKEPVTSTGPLSKAFDTPSPTGGSTFGAQLDEIAYNVLKVNMPTLNPEGGVLSLKEFTDAWLGAQNVTESQYRESLEHLYTILTGAYNGDTD